MLRDSNYGSTDLQNGLVSVFLDADPITGNVRLDRLDEAFVPGKTKAVMIAHALGNPFDLSRILPSAKSMIYG